MIKISPELVEFVSENEALFSAGGPPNITENTLMAKLAEHLAELTQTELDQLNAFALAESLLDGSDSEKDLKNRLVLVCAIVLSNFKEPAARITKTPYLEDVVA